MARQICQQIMIKNNVQSHVFGILIFELLFLFSIPFNGFQSTCLKLNYYFCKSSYNCGKLKFLVFGCNYCYDNGKFGGHPNEGKHVLFV